ncbi:hypothetical protein EDD21DRAFT_366928 [Dissophora ornata]|nr:hypothetical protein EDD21DRAFT_366928 [Dissophora ornata]
MSDHPLHTAAMIPCDRKHGRDSEAEELSTTKRHIAGPSEGSVLHITEAKHDIETEITATTTTTTLSEEFIETTGSIPLDVLSLPRHVPVEIWEVVCSYLPPSQLARLSRVSRVMYEVVCGLRLWKDWFDDLVDNTKIRYDDLAKFHPKDHHPAVYMLYLFARSFVLCEECRGAYQQRFDAGFMNFPLPVQMEVDDHMIKDTRITMQWTVRLCVKCRRKHYLQHPERAPRGLKGTFYTGDQVQDLFGFGRNRARSIGGLMIMSVGSTSWTEYPAYAALMKARYEYGGDIGIQHLRSKHEDAFEEMNCRMDRLTRKGPLLKNDEAAVIPFSNLWLPAPFPQPPSPQTPGSKEKTTSSISAGDKTGTSEAKDSPSSSNGSTDESVSPALIQRMNRLTNKLTHT